MAELQVFYHPSATISSIISTYFSYNGITACWNRSFSSGESWVITQPFVSTRCLDIDSLAFHWLLSYHADSWAHSRMISLYSSGSLFQVKAHIYHRTRFFLYLPYKKTLCFCVLSQSMSHYIDFVFSSTVKYFATS